MSTEPETTPLHPPAEIPPVPVSTTDRCYARLRSRIVRWAERKGSLASTTVDALLILPDFFQLLCGLALDPDVPAQQKAKITIAILYILSPVDFLPEAFFGPAAYLDDLVVAVLVLNQLFTRLGEDIINRHWQGEGDVIKVIRHILEIADELVGRGLLRRLQRFLDA